MFNDYVLPLKELHEHFCAEASVLRNLTPQTIRWYREGLRCFLRHKDINNIVQLNEIALTSFFFWGRNECKWSARTALTYYQSLSSFFSWCIKKGIIKESPLKSIPRPKLPKQLPKALSQKDAQRLFEFVQLMPIPSEYNPQIFHKRRDTAIFSMFLFTGLRRQELLDLKVINVNLDEDIITIRAGKGMKDRVIPISFELKKYLKMYMNEREKEKILSPYFFTSYGHQGRLGTRTLTRMFQRVREASGIYFCAHQLRHTFATLMAQSQCDLYSLSKMLGHSDIKTTTVYLSANTEHLKSQINKHPLNFL